MSKIDIFKNLNTKDEEAFVKKLAWKKASSGMKGPQHPDDIEEARSKAKKIFRNFISLRKRERAVREKARNKKQSPKRVNSTPKRVKLSFRKSVVTKKRFTKSSIYENLNTKDEEAFVKKLAWKKVISSIGKRVVHPYDAELMFNKFFKQFCSLRKRERALREKGLGRVKRTTKRVKITPKRVKSTGKRVKRTPKRVKASPKGK